MLPPEPHPANPAVPPGGAPLTAGPRAGGVGPRTQGLMGGPRGRGGLRDAGRDFGKNVLVERHADELG